MWLVLSHQEPQTQYKSEIKEKTLSRQESLDGLRISQKSAKTPLFTEFSDGLGGGNKSAKIFCTFARKMGETRLARALHLELTDLWTNYPIENSSP